MTGAVTAGAVSYYSLHRDIWISTAALENSVLDVADKLKEDNKNLEQRIAVLEGKK
jgi:hypothetical protein